MVLRIKNAKMVFSEDQTKSFFYCAVYCFMRIDNTLRQRWGATSNLNSSISDDDPVSDQDVGLDITTGLEMSNRFHSSALEWLTTWRIID